MVLLKLVVQLLRPQAKWAVRQSIPQGKLGVLQRLLVVPQWKLLERLAVLRQPLVEPQLRLLVKWGVPQWKPLAKLAELQLPLVERQLRPQAKLAVLQWKLQVR